MKPQGGLGCFTNFKRQAYQGRSNSAFSSFFSAPFKKECDLKGQWSTLDANKVNLKRKN